MVEPVVVVSNLVKQFQGSQGLKQTLRGVPRPLVRAVDDISFDVKPGEVFALVGESGSGKTTTALTLLGLVPPTKGTVMIAGQEVARLARRDLHTLRRTVQMIFQDPYESLNPRMTVGDIVAEPLVVHRLGRGRAERAERVVRALTQAGLVPAEVYLQRRPDELSGGQRQRVVIAAALVLEPRVLIADEPVSMLDVSIRAEILNLLAALAHDTGIALLIITHDLATVAAYSDRIGVMYLGRLVEVGATDEVLNQPRHPYTQALLSVVPLLHPDAARQRIILRGEIPDPAHIPSGCRFHPRCPVAFEACPKIDPQLRTVSAEQAAACLLVQEHKSGFRH